MGQTATIRPMGRKRKTPASDGGQHKTPRTSVMIPDAWLDIARRRAGTRPMPTLWYLVELIRKDAEAAGETSFPPAPWEDHPRSGSSGE